MSGLNERVNKWRKSAETPSLSTSTKKHNNSERVIKSTMNRESRIKDVMSKQFHEKRYSNQNILHCLGRKKFQNLFISLTDIVFFKQKKQDVDSICKFFCISDI